MSLFFIRQLELQEENKKRKADEVFTSAQLIVEPVDMKQRTSLINKTLADYAKKPIIRAKLSR